MPPTEKPTMRSRFQARHAVALAPETLVEKCSHFLSFSIIYSHIMGRLNHKTRIRYPRR